MKRIFLLVAAFAAIPMVFSQNTELIKSVFFGGGSAYIDPTQVAEIREFIQSVPNLESYQISISSHTDNIGGAEYNQWLSEKRSDAVTYELGQNQIPPERIGRIDNGQFNPLYDNSTLHGRMANRRVDIILTPLFL
ncbi:MAG: OmpA family protein [Bacteroidia bacterium]|nr:OmpA family protein [Bacteroidia bacterium]